MSNVSQIIYIFRFSAEGFQDFCYLVLCTGIMSAEKNDVISFYTFRVTDDGWLI